MKRKNKFKEKIDDGYTMEVEKIYQNEADDFLNLIDIVETLEGVNVDADERKMIWPDGEHLTINQSAGKIQKITGFDIERIKGTIIAWLEMEFIPEGLTRKQMKIYEKKIETWIKDYHRQ